MSKQALLTLFCVLSLPAMLFALLWQSGRFGRVEREIRQLQAAQQDYYDQNRRLIAQVAGEGSPEKISEIAEKRLQLIKDEDREVIRIVVVPE